MATSLQQYLSRIRIPSEGNKVFKDECMFSFDTPECETGLYVCMNTFMGFGKVHVDRHCRKTGNAVFLHLRRIKREVPQPDEDEIPKKKPTKMAIGVEGGFDPNQKQFVYDEHNTIIVLPEGTSIELDDPNIPDIIQMSAAGILVAESAAKADEVAAWDAGARVVSKHADTLVQLENGVKIPPTGWKCEKCNLTQNLWLNLTDGSILCGRRFFDGSGGNNHALESYEVTKYPLAVKLGTITPDGADVFSYDEDDMVEDPHLTKHLAHFGINITSLEKTEKTMVELEIDLNQKIGEWDVIQESGSKLTPLYGQGYTGMINLGNSCYMNSVMQVLFTIPDFQRKYTEAAEQIFRDAPDDPSTDFNVQMAKLGLGLMSGNYSKQQPEGMESLVHNGIRPQMFKTLIGRGHPEFSTKRQQDAEEYLLHLCSIIERHCRGTTNPTDCFKFEVEERIECMQSNMVKYSKRPDFILSLPIPMEASVNKAEVAAYEAKKADLEKQGQRVDPKELVRPRIPLSACLESFAAVESVDDFFSTALQAKSVASKTTRLTSFPDFLMIQLKKFTVNEDWTPKKLDVSVDVPDELDLSPLRGQGLQPGEQVLPDGQSQQQPEVQIDEATVSQLVDMGFPIEACKKAVFNTKNTGVESAMNWVMQHMDDPDFSAPFQPPGSSTGGGSKPAFVPNEEGLAMLMSMGFTVPQATKALKATDNNLERAADWIFSHADELDAPDVPEEAAVASTSQFRDGTGKYRLVAFISHMGTSTLVGHYVCHILKEGRWVIFNDEKVALSEHPPKDLAYLYLYQRV